MKKKHLIITIIGIVLLMIAVMPKTFLSTSDSWTSVSTTVYINGWAYIWVLGITAIIWVVYKIKKK